MTKDDDFTHAKRVLRANQAALKAFLVILSEYEKKIKNTLENSDNPNDIFRSQGAIRLIHKLQKVQEND